MTPKEDAAASVLTFVVAGFLFMGAVAVVFVAAGHLFSPATSGEAARLPCLDDQGNYTPNPPPGSDCIPLSPLPSPSSSVSDAPS